MVHNVEYWIKMLGEKKTDPISSLASKCSWQKCGNHHKETHSFDFCLQGQVIRKGGKKLAPRPGALGWRGTCHTQRSPCSHSINSSASIIISEKAALSVAPPLGRGSWLPFAGIICSDSSNLILQHSCITRSPFTFGAPCYLAQHTRYFA